MTENKTLNDTVAPLDPTLPPSSTECVNDTPAHPTADLPVPIPMTKPPTQTPPTGAASNPERAVDTPTEPNVTAAIPSQVQLKGRMLNFTRLQLQGTDVSDLLAKIEQKLGNQRHTRLPVVVSCEHPLDLATLWQGLWQLGLQPIGIVTGVLDEQAQAMPVAIFPADGERIDRVTKPIAPKVSESLDKPSDTPSDTPSEARAEPMPQSNETDTATERFTINSDTVSHVEGDLVWTQIVRSGQSINHVGGDLILTRGLNAGAEAITDYSLHVYGKAEGRLVAGATGDKNAKIFCLRFNPSLVSVAGTYCLRENIPSDLLNKAVQVSYRDEQGLVFELLEG